MTKSAYRHLYTDGAYFEDGKRLGAGWVCELPRGHNKKTGSARLPITEGTSATIAEIYAVCLGLYRFKSNSRIILHTDHTGIIDVVNNNKFLTRLRQSRNRPALNRAYKDLFNAVSRHQDVKAVKASEKNEPRLRKAHELAREGCNQEIRTLKINGFTLP